MRETAPSLRSLLQTFIRRFPGYGATAWSNVYQEISQTYFPLCVIVQVNLTAGVDNVFGKLYYDPLAGVNRVPGGVVPVGGIMPGAVRFGYIKLDWSL